MYTERRFRQLTQRVIEKGLDKHGLESELDGEMDSRVDSEGQTATSLATATLELTPDSLARVIALSEQLGMQPALLFNELIGCALGDAHDGFLTAYTDNEERECANRRLKDRVKALL